MRSWLGILWICLLVAPPAEAGPSTAFQSVSTERDTARVEGVLFEHRGFTKGRGILVLLPPSYADALQRSYPVLYAFSGRRLFDASGTPGSTEWTLDEILSRRPAGVPEMLVVSLDSGAESVADHAPPGSIPEAQGEALLHFLTEEVQPFIAGTYRIQAEPATTFLLGTDDGALFALYVALSRSDLFAGALALGCSDVDARSMQWMGEATPAIRPWIWLEQPATDKAHPSNADFLAALRQVANVQVVLTPPGSTRTSRLFAALRALPWH